jgi:hypothetical protein
MLSCWPWFDVYFNGAWIFQFGAAPFGFMGKAYFAFLKPSSGWPALKQKGRRPEWRRIKM